MLVFNPPGLARALIQMISFRLPNGAEFSFPVEWWNEVGMSAFERQSPYYLWDELPEMFVRIDAIEPPPMDYEGLDRVRMVSVLHAIVSRTASRPSKSRSYRWAIITIDYTTAHIASLRPSLLASRTFPPGCGSNSFPAISPQGEGRGRCICDGLFLSHTELRWPAEAARLTASILLDRADEERRPRQLRNLGGRAS